MQIFSSSLGTMIKLYLIKCDFNNLLMPLRSFLNIQVYYVEHISNVIVLLISFILFTYYIHTKI